MTDKSNSNSEHSNLFVISSQSSRSDNKRQKKENYIKFAKKVKELLDVPGNDLEQLYEKLENIVVKYFREHKIVDFQEMYAHIATLKSNSSKMTEIVTALEKRLCRSSSKHQQGRKSSKTQEFQTTINSHKQRNSLYQERASISNKEDLINIFNDHHDKNQLKYHHIFKPSKESSQQFTPKTNRSKKEAQASPSINNSPSKSSIQEYYNRNKQYESRIKEMMKQVYAIKRNITTSKKSQASQAQKLRINLRQNEQKPKIVSNSQKYKVEEQKSDSYLKPVEESSQQNIKNNNSSIHELINIATMEPEIVHNSFEQKQEKPREKYILKAEERQKQNNLQEMLKKTQKLTRQIQELKQVASRFEIEPENNSQTKKSENQIYPSDRINELIRKVSQEKSKKQPILEQIQNTTSQMNISENMIPSFRNLPHQQGKPKNERQIFTTELNFATTSKHPVNILYNQGKSNPQSLLASSQVVNSFHPVGGQQPPYNLSTIKYVYNPYPNSVVYPNHSLYIKPESAQRPQIFQPAPTPIQRMIYESRQRPSIGQQQANRAYIAQVSSPSSSNNNSSTSIMHPHLFAKDRQNYSLINQLTGQRSYMNQPPQGSINTIYSYPSNRSPNSGKSIQSSLNSQSSTSSLQRKGLNVTTHIQKKS